MDKDDKWEDLAKKHPAMFEHLIWPPECGKGWERLLDNLMTDIEGVLSNTAPEAVFRVMQIKEKFGGLRFYAEVRGFDTVPDDVQSIYDLIMVAEQTSTTICEFCGKDGSLRRDRRWVRTLCDTHAKKES